jgi:hypothetical protein
VLDGFAATTAATPMILFGTGVGARPALLGGVVPIDRPPNGPRFGAVLLQREDADEPERDLGVSPVTAASSLARREIN